MKLSLRWLSDHVDLAGLDPDAIARELTMKTALIEGIERKGAGLEKVRVGHVVHREKHPNADRLSFCKVDTGEAVLEVVCGAPNVATGQKIAYAPVGCTLPNGLTLEARKIRGILSNGMICSQQELGLGEEHDGILVLPADAPIGTPIAQLLGLGDAVFEIDNKSITHRADLWGHYGFARELAAIFGRPLKPLEVDASLKPEPASFPIELADPSGCPLYLALRAEYPSLPPTPDWMQQRLTATGMRPISLVVDLSNYVMLELGQPTHPFDEERLSGRKIVVRRAATGEKLTTLDEAVRQLAADDVVIADGQRGVAIAGVMGGRETEVGPETKKLLLESASFDGTRVRRTSVRLGLRTEAVARFEKALDPSLPELAIRRYAWWLRKIAPNVRIHAGFAVAGVARAAAATLVLRPERARAKLGYALPTAEMMTRLNSIGCETRLSAAKSGADESIGVAVPTWRARRDVTCEDDLIEEVGRLAGYERVPSALPRFNVKPPASDARRRLERAAVKLLVHECGYAEAIGYSFATDRQVALYHAATNDGTTDAQFVRLANSLTADATRLRRSLVPGLLDAVKKNLVEYEDVRLFESGREYLPERANAAGGDDLPRERRVLVAARARRGADAESLLLELRADVESCLSALRVPWEGRRPAGVLPPFAHTGRAIELYAGASNLGCLAQLHPEIARRFEIAEPAAVVELDLEQIALAPRPPSRMTAIPQFPPSRRDLAVVTPDERTVAEVAAEIRVAGGEKLARVELFDVYRGAAIAAGRRSLAFRLEYRAADRTLVDDEVDKMHQKVVDRLARQGIQLRA